MHWTKWPYWLKGGVIGGAIALASIVLSSACEYLLVAVYGYTGSGFQCMPFALPWAPFWFFQKITSLPPVLYETFGVITWILSGSFIGLIVGKLKLRKTKIWENLRR